MPHLLPLQAESRFFELVVVDATGPLVTVLLGGLIISGVTYGIQQKKAHETRAQVNARTDQIREQDLARAEAEAAVARHSRED